MTDLEQRKKAKEFAKRWKDKGYEKGEAQIFWTTLLTDIFEVQNVSEFIEFEDQVHIDKSTGFIDAYIPKTKILIEQKSIDKDLRKPIKQSDGSLLTPFQQAKKYITELPVSRHPRWVITCNFKSFLVYDMEKPNVEPEEILLKNLPKEYYRLQFIVDSKSEHIKKEEELSFKAGEIVGKLYDAFYKQYNDITNEQSAKDLNELCVRIVFCLYAEDAGLFGRKNIFHDYLNKYADLTLMRENLIKLFKTLDTPINKRDPYLEEELNQFPYVNGGLFSNENIEIPLFTEEIRDILLAKASDDFDWSEISPTIFGAVFESTLNPETRRKGGMHYTSIENIHKVIDPLFLNDLKKELKKALSYKNEKTRNEALNKFQNHIASLKFLDPACGSGNFLTETYLSLRKLENKVIKHQQKGRIQLDTGDIIKVHLNQFYGIEINDFAVKVAKTALWIAESQMLKETEELISKNLKFFPLETYNNIVEANALITDWNDVIPNKECNYIMGNPPFVGARLMSNEQKKEITEVFNKNVGNIDYVAAWFKKASKYIIGTKIEVSFVSTNSICQGEQNHLVWKEIIESGIKINFAYKTFRWSSEAKGRALVYCVIIGFSYINRENKILFLSDGQAKKVKHINSYLIDANDVFIDKKLTPIIKSIPKMTFGSMPNDGGNLLLNKEDLENLDLKKCMKFIKKFTGAEEFLYSSYRYCIWLKDVNPSEYINNKFIYNRIAKVKQFRLESKREATRKLANSPMLFGEIRQPNNDYLIIPCHTIGTRKYIPIMFLNKDVIASNAAQIIPNADLYHFSILTSNVHMAWVSAVCGWYGPSYRYSAGIVYNNFPWPNPTQKQKEKINKTAKRILNTRKLYSKSSLADLYDDLTMPPELRKAHQENDKAVMEAYGFDYKKMTETDIVAELMKMYQKLVEQKSKN